MRRHYCLRNWPTLRVSGRLRGYTSREIHRFCAGEMNRILNARAEKHRRILLTTLCSQAGPPTQDLQQQLLSMHHYLMRVVSAQRRKEEL